MNQANTKYESAPLSERDGNIAATSDHLPQENTNVAGLEKPVPRECSIEQCQIQHIVLTTRDANPVQKRSQKQPRFLVWSNAYTRLRSIGNVDIQNLSMSELRKFCARIRMQSPIRGLKKVDLCRLLVERKHDYDQDMANGKPDRVFAPKRLRPQGSKIPPSQYVNLFRLSNVLCSDDLKDFYYETGDQCFKEDLQDDHYSMVTGLYNDQTKFNDDRHVRIAKSSCPSPGKFEKIHSWQVVKNAAQDLVMSYKFCLRQLNQNGVHSSTFEELNFSNFSGLKGKKDIMTYIHSCEQECPGILDMTIVGGDTMLPQVDVWRNDNSARNATLTRTAMTPTTESQGDVAYNKLKMSNQRLINLCLREHRRFTLEKHLRWLDKQRTSIFDQICNNIQASNPALDRRSVRRIATNRLAAYEKKKKAAAAAFGRTRNSGEGDA
eukprot:scaffold1869_cov122-Cylindrotheca_fusiformis.AAC.19